MSILTIPPTSHSPVSLPKPHYSLRHNNIEIWSINNPTVASKCSSERKSHMSLTLNQKLEMIKLSEEGMLKAEKTKLLEPNSQVTTAEEKFLKEIMCYSSEHMNDKKAKQPYC